MCARPMDKFLPSSPDSGAMVGNLCEAHVKKHVRSAQSSGARPHFRCNGPAFSHFMLEVLMGSMVVIVPVMAGVVVAAVVFAARLAQASRRLRAARDQMEILRSNNSALVRKLAHA